MLAVFVIVGIIAVAAFLWRHPLGRMFRVAMSGVIRQLYFYWHPHKQAMPTSLEESRTRTKQHKQT